MRKLRNLYVILMENPKENDHFEDFDVDGYDNTEVNVEEIRCEGVDWIHLAQGRF
jgi:hypothetical protein